MTGYRSIGIRIKVACWLFGLLFVLLVYHLYTVQILRHEELFSKAKAKYTIEKEYDGIRGEIFDYDGNLLVGNTPYGCVIGDPSAITSEKECRETAAFLARELSVDEDRLFRQLNRKKTIVTEKDGTKKVVERRYVLIDNYIEFNKFERHRLNIMKANLRGIKCLVNMKRTYPKNEMLSNILGFTNIDRDRVIARSGLEKFYDRNMSSVAGKMKYERSRDGIPLSFGEVSKKKEHDGYNLYLTIREPIQAILEEEIDKLMESTKAVRAYAVMADPYTGDILAVAQRPTFNPNDRSTLKEFTSRNPIAEMAFEPGSIMKPFPVAGALDRGVVTPETRFDCEHGRWFYAGKLLRDSHPMGVLTVSEIIQQSSNIGTAKIAIELGEPNLRKTLEGFGFGQKTGAPLRPETIGLFYKNPTKISITRYPIGQGISASPLQIVRAYCILANGGHSVQLRFVDRIQNPDTGEVQKVPVQRGQALFRNPSTHREIVDMMKRVTEPGGTAKNAAIRGYHVAGKTGTAQKAVNGVYSHEKYTASFVGFVPADNPRFVLLVTADEPQGAYYGGAVSGPYFKSIAERTLKYLHVPPDVNFETYDANLKLAEQKILDEKKRLWAREREEKEQRQLKSAERTADAGRSYSSSKPLPQKQQKKKRL
ncbi:MAG: Penicillin-binding protein 2 [Lentisphaerae bacterium ADurb.Bin242]|nr:MAG: Penicillin-binding protein 2 [Lentisphaerae bacterium ADurb.Bin242]